MVGKQNEGGERLGLQMAQDPWMTTEEERMPFTLLPSWDASGSSDSGKEMTWLEKTCVSVLWGVTYEQQAFKWLQREEFKRLLEATGYPGSESNCLGRDVLALVKQNWQNAHKHEAVTRTWADPRWTLQEPCYFGVSVVKTSPHVALNGVLRAGSFWLTELGQMLPREEMFPGRGCHSSVLYLGFHNCFYSDRVLGIFFPLQIRKQEGGCGKETTVIEITSILGQRLWEKDGWGRSISNLYFISWQSLSLPFMFLTLPPPN